jgi:hypothetical protein
MLALALTFGVVTIILYSQFVARLKQSHDAQWEALERPGPLFGGDGDRASLLTFDFLVTRSFRAYSDPWLSSLGYAWLFSLLLTIAFSLLAAAT